MPHLGQARPCRLISRARPCDDRDRGRAPQRRARRSISPGSPPAASTASGKTACIRGTSPPACCMVREAGRLRLRSQGRRHDARERRHLRRQRGHPPQAACRRSPALKSRGASAPVPFSPQGCAGMPAGRSRAGSWPEATKTASIRSNRRRSRQGAPLEPPFGRLCLITPPVFDAATFAPLLDAALASGEVASLIIVDSRAWPPRTAPRRAEKLVPIAQANGAAAIVAGKDRPGDGGRRRRAACRRRHRRSASRRWTAGEPDRIVGAGDIHSRHDAMLLAETECDYLFFGRFDGDTTPRSTTRRSILRPGGRRCSRFRPSSWAAASLDCVAEAVPARIEFVALRSGDLGSSGRSGRRRRGRVRLVLAAQTEAAT